MIESIIDLNRFQAENADDDWIVHVIPEDDTVHPMETKACILFIRTISGGNTYYYSFTHPDSVPSINSEYFIHEILLRMKHKIWAIDKKALEQSVSIPNIRDINLIEFLQDNSILELSDYDTPAHYLIRSNSSGHKKINLAIPLLKHKETFDEMADDVTVMINKLGDIYNNNEAYTRFNDIIIGTLGKLESNGIFVDRELFKKRFNIDVGARGITYSKYNTFTSTGRPSNSYNGVNYAALNHTDGTRKCFCSRHGKDGKIVVIDYTAFHPQIISTLTKYPIPGHCFPDLQASRKS